jgi:hypothetical protein
MSSPTETEIPGNDPYSTEGLQVVEYTVAEFEDTASSVEVTYIDENEWVYSRQVNIPRDESGQVNQEEFDQILYSQLLGVNNKKSIGIVVFKDPNAVEATETTEESASEE